MKNSISLLTASKPYFYAHLEDCVELLNRGRSLFKEGLVFALYIDIYQFIFVTSDKDRVKKGNLLPVVREFDVTKIFRSKNKIRMNQHSSSLPTAH